MSEESKKVEAVEVEELAPLKPKAETAEKTAKPADDDKGQAKSSANKPSGKRRVLKRNNNNHHGQQNKRSQGRRIHEEDTSPVAEPEAYEFLDADRLEQMTQPELVKQVRRLESILYKEQARREASGKMSQGAMQYAEAIKDQVAQRVQDVQQTMQETIDQLKVQIEAARKQAESDLTFYREQLAKANNKLMGK